MCIPVQKYKFQYKNKSFGTEKLKILYIIFFFAFFKFFFAAAFIFVLRFIFLYWDKYCCTVVYMNFTVLKNIVAQPMNMFVLELMFLY